MMHSHTVFSMLAGSITRPAGRATSGLNHVLAVTMGLALFASAPLAATAQSNGQAELLLREAMHAEISDGDLGRAIELYRTIVERYGNTRSVAAQALLRIGMSYEKLGMREAREAFEELRATTAISPMRLPRPAPDSHRCHPTTRPTAGRALSPARCGPSRRGTRETSPRMAATCCLAIGSGASGGTRTCSATATWPCTTPKRTRRGC